MAAIAIAFSTAVEKGGYVRINIYIRGGERDRGTGKQEDREKGRKTDKRIRREIDVETILQEKPANNL